MLVSHTAYPHGRMLNCAPVFIYTTLEPYLMPLLKTATSQLMTASTEVINSSDQYEVFNDPRASDPTHSFLSKDHFVRIRAHRMRQALTPFQNLILNEPAGNLAMIIVKHTVSLVVKAWADTSVHPRSVTEDVLQCLYASPSPPSRFPAYQVLVSTQSSTTVTRLSSAR